MPAFDYKGDLTCSMCVTSLDASIKWYQETLGFKLLYRVDDIRWCELATHVREVSVGLGERETPETRGGCTLVFGVMDIEKARGELEAKGVRFDGKTLEIPGMVKLATFFDPDGNKFMFSQNLQK